uniref:Citrate transporter-like domain-containing protein n=2 Tax=Corethron hystrix TaxID=216773 RepID=A0A7S1BYQ9_9STRA|mmetsp:Transcript_7133/g.15456  ORF Transcript_7133/g.15456 Transcript_7133/m.15456 type:complete len:635 (+) Transcript_7133:86-1990(+)|eukprot:CAMPEP_0113313410 /NCGR_PEP_ID=MMETSP0010_2-20120614/9846_1 /TAXON_ID=216773 ORGANISM="Corethron hystrix, Strain 308" /NCGR_SAMPLE_ID=MMETSP0010_2 /ASSEMBLY_ACC=CAM_ASM_000155 /LENGTH=634 /DNA_ID=CAMNT_0000169419 /DNA_START=38 /DNA_END=1942 /DNA_ORIENTATION=- /assembly_acc=CAM_ASM_000155
MISTSLDVEAVHDAVLPQPKNNSALRTWAPALVAVGAAIAVNSVLMGGIMSQTKVPGLTQEHLAEREQEHALMDQVRALEISDPTWKPTSRRMSDKSGDLLEYTRRRHRLLTNYLHEDVSDQFSAFGKILISVIYFAFWVFLMFPNWFLPIGRPGIALGGGMMMVVVRYVLQITNNGPFFDAEKVIIMEPLMLLFGLMLTTIYLEKMERGGLFDKLRDSLDDPINWKRSAKIMIMSTIGSAAVMNDSVVLIFSGVVVDLCVRHKVANSLPYLLSLATTANIGSALTMTGNPQNILIVSLAYDTITWFEFATNMIVPVTVATIINFAMMLAYYRQELFPGSAGIGEDLGIMFMGRKTPEMLAQERSYYASRASVGHMVEASGWSIWSVVQSVVVICFLIFFAGGYDVCVVSITAGCVLMVAASYKRQHYDPRPQADVRYDDNGEPIPPKKLYDLDGNEITPEDEELITESETTLTEVDYGLLMLFIGQFLLIGSFDDTGVPQGFFAATMGKCAAREVMTTGGCVYWFVVIITILSNVASNVPVCQMLAATFPFATPYQWMQVSFSATIAGNLTMLGSAANMIVAFQAAKVGDRTFTSERHAPFGIPSTLGCLFIGTWLLSVFAVSPDCSVRKDTC